MDAGIIVSIASIVVVAATSIGVALIGKRASVTDMFAELRATRKELADTEEASDLKDAAHRRTIVVLTNALMILLSYIARIRTLHSDLPDFTAGESAIIDQARQIEPALPTI